MNSGGLLFKCNGDEKVWRTLVTSIHSMEISVLFWRLFSYAIYLPDHFSYVKTNYLTEHLTGTCSGMKREIIMLFWISYYIPIIPCSCRHCILQWTNIDQNPAMFQCGAIMSFQFVKSRREEGLLKSPKAFFLNPPWVNSVYETFHSYWWTKVSFPLKCRAGKSLKTLLIFSSPFSNPGNETTSSICTPCLCVLKNLQWQIQKGSLAYYFQYLTVFTVKRIFLIFDLYLSYKLSWLLHQYRQQATTIQFYSSLLHIGWPEQELIERSPLAWFIQKTDQMITTVPSGFIICKCLNQISLQSKNIKSFCFLFGVKHCSVSFDRSIPFFSALMHSGNIPIIFAENCKFVFSMNDK